MEMNMKQRYKMRTMISALIFLLIGLMGMTSCTAQEDPTGSNVLEVLDIQREDVSAVWVEYLGVSVALDAETAEQILDSFSKAQCTKVMEQEPFNESEFVLTIEYNNEKKTIPICWFNGVKTDDQGNDVQYQDRRVDICVNGRWFVFQQDETVFWNEEYLIAAFYSEVRSENIDMPSKYQIDGYDAHSSVGGYDTGFQISHAKTDGKSAAEILEEAENIVIVSLIDYEYMKRGISDSEIYDRVFKVKVEECLKGSITEAEIYIQPELSATMIDGITYATYPSVQSPDLQPGRQYLLCLSDQNQFGWYSIINEVTACAVIADDVLYPRYNTEHHPFYEISLDEVRSMAAR